MKYLIILIIFIFCSDLSFAQDRILCTQSSNWNKRYEKWYHSRVTFDYHNENLIKSKTHTSWDDYHGRWENDSRYTRTYNAKGHVIKALNEHSASGISWSPMPIRYFEYFYNKSDEPEIVFKHWETTKHNPHLNNRVDTFHNKLPNENLKHLFDEQWLMKNPNCLRYDKKGQVVFKKVKHKCRNMVYEYHIEYYPDGRYKGFLSYSIDELTGEKVPYKKVTHFYKSEEHLITFEKPEDVTLFQNDYENNAISAHTGNSIVEKKSNTIGQKKNYEIQTLEFDLFPNPSQNDVYVKPGISLDVPLKIKIYDALGRLVYQQELSTTSSEEISLTTRHLQAGIYHVLLEAMPYYGTKRFIKMD